MSWIAGIDYSTRAIDVVLVDEDDAQPPRWIRHDLQGQDAFDRTRDVRRSLRWQWSDDYWAENCAALGIEDPRGQNAGALYRIQGAILAHLLERLLVQPWIPSQWRKAVGLPGNASKQQVKAFADAMLPRQHIDDRPSWATQDAADAWCIALATRQAITRTREEAA